MVAGVTPATGRHCEACTLYPSLLTQTPAPERTPAWCGPDSLKDAAGPRSWRGVGVANEDWGRFGHSSLMSLCEPQPRASGGMCLLLTTACCPPVLRFPGELNTGKRPPAPYVLDLTRREVVKVSQGAVGDGGWGRGWAQGGVLQPNTQGCSK